MSGCAAGSIPCALLCMQAASLHPPGKICMSLCSIKKGIREGNAERPFSSEITESHNHYLEDIWTCSNIQQINEKMATGFKNLKMVPLLKFLLRTEFYEVLCSPLPCEDTNQNLFTLDDWCWSFPWTSPYHQEGDAQSGDASAFLFSVLLQQCQYNLTFCFPHLNTIWIFQVLQEGYTMV